MFENDPNMKQVYTAIQKAVKRSSRYMELSVCISCMQFEFFDVESFLSTQRMRTQASSLEDNVGDIGFFLERSARSFAEWVKARADAQQTFQYADKDLKEALTKREKTSSSSKVASLTAEIKKVFALSLGFPSYRRYCSSRIIVFFCI